MVVATGRRARTTILKTKIEAREVMENPIYLGDAVYAYLDGNGIELKLNHHVSRCLIYLEPEVMEALEACV